MISIDEAEKRTIHLTRIEFVELMNDTKQTAYDEGYATGYEEGLEQA